MIYDELTDDQKTDIERYDVFMRGTISSLMHLHRQADPQVWRQWADENIDPWLAGLTGDVPNHTNLGGATEMSADEFRGLQTILRGLTTIANDNLALIVKAVGVNA